MISRFSFLPLEPNEDNSGAYPRGAHRRSSARHATDQVFNVGRQPGQSASIHALPSAFPPPSSASRSDVSHSGATELPILQIVIVDDNAHDRDLMRRYLLRDATCRFEFREAATGAQGIEASLAIPAPDCVLLDLRLPDMGGLQFIDRLRCDKAGLPFPVIVLTGFEDTAQQGKAALMLGAQDYLGKSFITPESLSRAVANAMERFRLAQQVRHSELYFRTLFESAGVANAETDARTGTFLRVNKRFCELVGYSAAELLGMTFLQITHPEDRERNATKRRQAEDGNHATFDIEKRYVRKDGSVIWVHVSTSLMRDDAGELKSFLGSIFDITETRRAQDAMRLATTRFETALRGSSVVVFNQDLDLRYTWIYNSSIGFDPSQIIGRRDADIWSAEDAARVEVIKRGVLLTGVSRREEITVHQEGCAHCYDLQIDPTRDAAGHITGITCAAIDITQRKLAQDLLAQTTEQLTLFANHAPAAIAMLDAHMRYITVTERWLADFGLTGQDVRGKSHYELFPDLPERWKDVHRRCLAGAVERADEDCFLDASGPRWLRWEIRPWREASGAVGGIVIFSEDISERKRAEQALTISEQRFRLAAAAAHAMVFDLDVKAARLNSMEGLQALLGYAAPLDQLTMAWWEDRIEPADLPIHRTAIESMHRQPQPLSLAYRMRHIDGRTIWVTDNVAPVLDSDGNLERIVGTVVDITATKSAEQALQRADRDKDTFIATLAHELRNPLAPVANATKVMKELTLNDPKLIWCREVIERQVGQMARLLDDLLDISRITSNKLTLRLEPMDLHTVIEHAIEMARPLINAAGHSLDVTLPDHSVMLRGDRVRLAQVFSNLLTNSAKYTHVNGRIEVSAFEQGSQIRIDVADNGIGLAAGDLERVFSMFGQVESALERSQGGLGIGLSLVKGLVALHGGSISAHSEGLGKGSRFVVCLPLIEKTSILNPSPAERRKGGGSHRILVVDDNPDNADSLAMLLQLGGHQVEKAYEGRLAIEKAKQIRPEVILLDIGLPGMNGYDICRAIRQEPWGHDITILAVTGWGQNEDLRRARDAGFTAHLTKPIDHARLMDLIRMPRP